jgi:Ca2+-binding RTX toxin-like protein
MASDKELVIMSQQTYFEDGGQPPAGWVFVIDSDDLGIGLGSGYYGAVYRNTQTNEIVFAHRGTEFTQENDVEGLLQAALNAGLSQFVDAEVFYNLVKADADFFAGAFPGSVFHTGHSLGGGIANLMGARTGETTVGFNSIGVKGVMTQYGLDPNGSYGNIRNISAFYDPAKTVGEKIGTTQNVFVSSFAWIPDLFEPVVTFLGFKVGVVLGVIAAKYFTFSQHNVDKLVETISALGNITSDIQLTPAQEADFQDLEAALNEVPGLSDQAAARLFANGPSLNATQIQLEATTNETTVRSYAAEAGNDLVMGGDAGDQLSGGQGDDLIFGDTGDDEIDGGDGNDFIVGGFGRDTIQGSAGDDVAVGREGDDVLLGGSGRDQLNGGDGADVVDGGAEDDVLRGGPGTDSLVGGTGFDTYVWSPGDGSDVIVDEDRRGRIVIKTPSEDITVGDLLEISDNVYRSANGALTLTHSSPWTLVMPDGSTIDLGETFADGDLGINLREAQAAHDDEEITLTLSGDLEPVDFNPDTPGTQTQTDSLGNVIVTGNAEPGRADTLFGDASANAINGLDGNDTLSGRAGDDDLDGGNGDDSIFGEAGFDKLLGGLGSDFLDGGADDDELLAGANDDALQGGLGYDRMAGQAGRDLLSGQEGDDELYAGELINLADLDDALAAGETQAGTGLAGDLLDGGVGEDIALGGADDDQISGAGGADVLAGGGGADNLQGDWALIFAGPDWTATRSVTTEANGTVYTLTHTNAFFDIAADGGNDEIYGGTGEDWVFAGAGDDYLDGGADNDVLFGEEGFDVLFGGAGDDVVVGDAGNIASPAQVSDYLDGEDGNDTLFGGGGADQIFGGLGNDRLLGDDTSVELADQGGDYLDGEDGNDELLGFGGDDELFGGLGADSLFGGAGNDYLDGEEDADLLNAGDGDDILFGGAGADILEGDEFVAGSDYLDGEDGDDSVAGRGGADIIFGGSGNDLLFGDSDDVAVADQGADFMSGGAGNDTLRGYGGDDQLFGDEDNDLLFGEAGNDVLDGGDGADRLSGGEGNDNIVGGLGADTIVGDAGNDFIDGGGDADLIAAGEGNDEVAGGAGIDELQGGTGDDTLDGGADADTLFGEVGNDMLFGGDGADQLVGDSGADTLDGGTGNDTFFGATGNDTYIFGRGYGHDIIVDQDVTAGNIDVIRFAPDISPDDVTAARHPVLSGWLLLTVDDTGNRQTNSTLEVGNHFFSAEFRVEEIRFADSTLWTPTTTPLLISGTTGTDFLNGTSGQDVFDGLAGNDALSGGAGNDTYRFYRGDGQDTVTDVDSTAGNVDKIVFASDILPSQMQASRSGDNLVLRLPGTTNQVTVTNYFLNDGVSANSVEQIKFLADGTVWDVDTIKSMVIVPTNGNDNITGYATDDVLSGLGGNDTIRGSGGNDTLDGGTGNDSLFGEDGSDTYLFARGGGQDLIVNATSDTAGSTDVLSFAADILPGDVALTVSGNDIVLSLQGSTDQVRIQNYLLGGQNTVEEIRFADGTVWTDTTIGGMLVGPPINGTAGPDVLQGTVLSEALNGFAGNDTIHGGSGNDTIDGGLGSDLIQGESGNDQLIAGGDDSASDMLSGGAGEDVLVGGTGGDALFGEAGIDLLLGGSGPREADTLEDTAGNNLFIAGRGNDQLNAGAGNDLLIGAGGDDTLRLDAALSGLRGSDIVAFNRGDGQDFVLAGGASGTVGVLSLGGGISYSNLQFDRVGNNLILKAGGPNRITFEDWYSAANNHSISRLQIAIEGLRIYDPTSTDPLRNQRVQVFDFAGLVDAFDQAQAAGTRFSVADNLAQFRLSGSDTEAYGGNLTYRYAVAGTVNSLTHDEMRAIVSAPEFAVAAQPFTSTQVLLLEPFSTEGAVAETTALANDANVMSADAGMLDAPTPTVYSLPDPTSHAAIASGRSKGFGDVAGAPSGNHIQGRAATASGAIESPGATEEFLSDMPAAMQQTGDAVRRAARSDLPQELWPDDMVALLSERLSRAPHFHFEALAEFFEAEANKNNAVLTSAQIASNWARVRAYTDALGVSASADDFGGAGPFGFGYGSVAGGLEGESWSLPVRRAVGLNDTAAANLKQLEGVSGAMKVLG